MSFVDFPRAWIIAGAAGIVAGLAGPAQAVTEVDLTSGAAAIINDGRFSTLAEDVDDTPAEGTGVFDPFLRIHMSGVEEGYNTDRTNSDMQFDEVAGIWTRSLRLGDLSVDVDGYITFLLDLQEPTGGDQVQVSLDAMQIWVGSSADPGAYENGAFGAATLIYDMDGSGDTQINLTSGLYGSGQGRFDMEFTLLAAVFGGLFPDTYVTLYSKFGSGISAEGAFEEWAALQGGHAPVPLPSLGWLFLLAVGGLGSWSAARRRVA